MRILLKALAMKYIADITLRMACLMSYTAPSRRLHYKLFTSSIPIWVYDPKHKIGNSLGSFRLISPGWWEERTVITVSK